MDDDAIPAPRDGAAILVDRESLHRRTPGWAAAAVESLDRAMVDLLLPFPCTFGVDAYRRNALRFVFVDDACGAAGLTKLATSLSAYLAISHTLGKVTSLLAFLDTSSWCTTMVDHERQFWRILQHLHDVDTHPWPGEYPQDPDSPRWEFCYGGVAMFVVCATPAHQGRRSRQAHCMLMTFQPRFVFDGLEHGTAAGDAARRIIRRRLAAYDDVPVYPHLAGYGQPGTREWRQYFITDSNEDVLRRCPLRLGRARVATALPEIEIEGAR